VTVTVLLFAGIAEKAGWRKRSVDVAPGETIAQVRDRIIADWPTLAPYVPNLLYALDESYARENDLVRDGSTLALIPPVSGG
jgi:molybdopterin converting factor subunit 1